MFKENNQHVREPEHINIIALANATVTTDPYPRPLASPVTCSKPCISERAKRGSGSLDFRTAASFNLIHNLVRTFLRL